MSDPNGSSRPDSEGEAAEAGSPAAAPPPADSAPAEESAAAAAGEQASAPSETPPQPGGSKLFPQLPDDPRLIENQERARAAAANADPSDPGSSTSSADPAAVTSVMSSSELQAGIESPPAGTAPAAPATPAAPPAGGTPAAPATPAAPGTPTSSNPASDKHWENWTDLDTPAQWRDGSQDFQAPISSDETDTRSVQQTPEIEEAAHTGRNVMLAIVVGIILGSVFFGALSAGRAVVVVLAALALVIALAEFFAVARTVGYRPATLFGLTAVAGLTGAVYWRGFEAYPLFAALIGVGGLLWFLIGVEQEHPTANFAVTTMGIAWIGGLGSFAALMLREPHGDAVLVAVVVGTVAYDVLGYVIGSTTGQTRLAYRVSPNKTVEGLIGGIVLSAIITSLVLYRFPGIFPFTEDVLDAVWLAVIIALAAPLGDLCQSLIKRDLQVKDMGTVLPGHGGVLDRFDAMLFVLPAAYYMSDFLVG